MSDPHAAFAAAAARLEGARFRLHGRDPATGLDCVGVVIAALTAIGRTSPPLPRYALRNTGFAPFERAIEKAGFREHRNAVQAGDLIVAMPSPGQFHLAICITGHRIVHAHAGLRRVVISPLASAEPVIRRFRLI